MEEINLLNKKPRSHKESVVLFATMLLMNLIFIPLYILVIFAMLMFMCDCIKQNAWMDLVGYIVVCGIGTAVVYEEIKSVVVLLKVFYDDLKIWQR